MISSSKINLAAAAFFASTQFISVSLADTNSSAYPSDISWGPCSQEFEKLKSYNTTIDCGNLTVPLDYHDLSKGVFELNLLRAHAPKGPARGSVQLNYGGPGEPGRADLAKSLSWNFAQVTSTHSRMSELLTQKFRMTGYVYDLIAFDQRSVFPTSLSTLD